MQLQVGLFSIFLGFYLFFRERGREEEQERKTLMCKRNTEWFPLTHLQLGAWPTTQACVPTGNHTCDPLAYGMTPNPLSHTSEGTIVFFMSLIAYY